MIKKLDHIGVAVREIETSLSRWEILLNQSTKKIEDIPERGVRVAHLEIPGGGSVELVEPLASHSPVAKFLESRGEGIHHLCFEVENIETSMDELKKNGVRFITDRPVCGAGGGLVVFARPQDMGGVLMELREIPKKISSQPE